jgi:DNA-binding XRE family transcriptional regulator
VFPLIEKHGHFCYGVIGMKLFSLPKDKAKKPARRKLIREDVFLAQRIKQLRKERGLTQEELSDILGMNTLYITQVEAKQQGLSLPMVYRIAKVLNIPLRELFSF